MHSLSKIFKSQIAYDLRPWFCVAVSLVGIKYAGFDPAKMVFPLMLLACGGAIFYLRHSRRPAYASTPRGK